MSRRAYARPTAPQPANDDQAKLYQWLYTHWRKLGPASEYFTSPTQFRVGTLVGTFANGSWSVTHEREKRWEVVFGTPRQVPGPSWDPLACDSRKPTVAPVRWETPEISRRLVEVDDPDKEDDAMSLQEAMNKRSVPREF